MIPKTVINQLNQFIEKFLWGQKDEERRIHWYSWKITCSHKYTGRIGLRDLESFNQSFLAKQGWRILSNPNSLLVRYLSTRCFPRGEFLEANQGYSPRFSWQSILVRQQLLKKGVTWNIMIGSPTLQTSTPLTEPLKQL